MLYMKSQTLKAQCAEGVFQIQSTICGVNFSNTISITQIRVNERKTNLTRPLKPPLTINFSPCIFSSLVPCKTTPHKFAQKVCSPCKCFLRKKLLYTLQGQKQTLCFIFTYFPISKSFISNFCGTNYHLSSKTTQLVFLKSQSMISKFSKLL